MDMHLRVAKGSPDLVASAVAHRHRSFTTADADGLSYCHLQRMPITTRRMSRSEASNLSSPPRSRRSHICCNGCARGNGASLGACHGSSRTRVRHVAEDDARLAPGHGRDEAGRVERRVEVGVDHRQRRRPPRSDEVGGGVSGDDCHGAGFYKVGDGTGEPARVRGRCRTRVSRSRPRSVMEHVKMNESCALVRLVHVREPDALGYEESSDL